MDTMKYEKIAFTTRTACQVCGAALGEPLIELPALPMTEIFVREKPPRPLALADQAFAFCEKCSHGQLTRVLDPNLQYDHRGAYDFRTSKSASARMLSDFVADFIVRETSGRKFGTALEIGASDLYLLKRIRNVASRLVGVDPVLAGVEAEHASENVLALGGFFEDVELPGRPELVICNNTLEHVSAPREFLEKALEIAAPNALFVFAFPVLDFLVLDGRYEQVCHQHLNYFSFRSFSGLLSSLGCSPSGYAHNTGHWGSDIVVAFRKNRDGKALDNLARKIEPREIVSGFDSFKASALDAARMIENRAQDKLFGYGASPLLPVLCYHMETDLAPLEAILDDDPSKKGSYYINLAPPIILPGQAENLSGATFLHTGTTSRMAARAILKKLLEINARHIIYPTKTI